MTTLGGTRTVVGSHIAEAGRRASGREVLRLLAQGIPKKAIGRYMSGREISVATVNTYFSRIAKKYAALRRPVGDSLGAIREAERDGYLELVGDPEWARALLERD